MKINDNYILKVCKQQLNIPPHKVRYALLSGMLNGAFKSLENYNIPLNKEVFRIFFDVVGEKLSESKEIEHEWSENEYNSIMEIYSLYCSK